MDKVAWKGAALLAPVPPVLVSCGTKDAPNVLTVAWTGTLCTQPPKTYVSIRPERYSHDIIATTKEFVINLPTAALVRAVDWCGVKSGRDTDKFAGAHLTAQFVEECACPLVAESPVSLVCHVTDVIPLGTHDMFMADITAVHVAENLLDEQGKLRLAKAGLMAYAHGEYFALGRRIGGFGCSVKKKKKRPGKDTQKERRV